MDNNFIHPETKTPEIGADNGNQHSAHPDKPDSAEGSQNQINADYEGRLHAARQIIESESNAEALSGAERSGDKESPDPLSEATPEIGESHSIDNINAIISGDPGRVKKILDASQMDVPELAILIKENKAPHAFEGVSPDKLVEALGNASDDHPDYPSAA